MTRVDFYLLDRATEGGKDAAVCKLAHKAFRLGHRIYILTHDHEGAQRLDRLLWTFSAGSFIPHGLGARQADVDLPVLIGRDEPPAAHEDVLIQLLPQVPEFFSRFQRVAEVVDGSDDEKTLARERFRFYRDRGYALQTHKLELESAGA
ncbi:DNA polymerase III subunit chi [Sulfuricaulis sp.]|jgi:DNA polymerase-3 subunit chi|uniref:DNA polymerase III subunit chi n=1 Tax=Sulfuricaulis sp. TaxID=2003553 RepID=UPI00355A8183